MSDLFGVAGIQLLDRLDLPSPYAARIASLRRLIDDLDFEIDLFAGMVRGRMAREWARLTSSSSRAQHPRGSMPSSSPGF